jgi:UDP-N-acetylmuramoyl-L-alanyl-D-glutamate--2,6-diaminopimelate ligase
MPDKTVSISQLADALPGSRVIGDGSISVSSLAYDSRQILPGSLFVAVVGEKFDGHRFLTVAVEAGAAAVVVQSDRADEYRSLSVPMLVVPSTRAALAPLSCRFYGDPTRALFLAGVTGTNGKTTTVRMIDAIARAAGDTTGTVGTLGATIDGRDLPGDRTTPESADLQRLFAEMLDEGVDSAAMEVASHAIAMGRTDGCTFDVGVFTNLTQDHLDFHGDMETYRDTKLRLFTEYADAASVAGKRFSAVLNLDDPTGKYFLRRISESHETIVFGNARGTSLPEAAYDLTYFPELVVARVDSLRFTARVWHAPYVAMVQGVEASEAVGPVEIAVVLNFGGLFNVHNALGAVGYGVARGLAPDTIAEGLAACPPVPGRFQPVQAGQDFAVIVDYAHTPDGLENVLRSSRSLTEGRLIVVFGCGGDRDRTKRPKMGRIAGELADIAIVTSDNPRSEVPEAIIDEVQTGMRDAGADVRRESDRRAAITLAVRLAKTGDTVVIAGKGHENYQIIGDRTLPFDDVIVAGEEIRHVA